MPETKYYVCSLAPQRRVLPFSTRPRVRDLRLIWQELEEKHKLLSITLEAVYIDLAASRSIVGIQPKPVFYPLFNSLENQTGNTILVFHDKKIEPTAEAISGTVMVETGETPFHNNQPTS